MNSLLDSDSYKFHQFPNTGRKITQEERDFLKTYSFLTPEFVDSLKGFPFVDFGERRKLSFSVRNAILDSCASVVKLS